LVAPGRSAGRQTAHHITKIASNDAHTPDQQVALRLAVGAKRHVQSATMMASSVKIIVNARANGRGMSANACGIAFDQFFFGALNWRTSSLPPACLDRLLFCDSACPKLLGHAVRSSRPDIARAHWCASWPLGRLGSGSKPAGSAFRQCPHCPPSRQGSAARPAPPDTKSGLRCG
jgi:hypothetical protein